MFAPILFPVLFKANAGDPDPLPDGTFDQLLIETAEYDDGFAKIVHAHQPQSRNLLAETPEEGKPVKDAGIRLGWDDEQILIWYLRQLAADSSVKDLYDKRLDAPLGVFGYAIDVRETAGAGEAMGDLEQSRKPRSRFLSRPGRRNQSRSAISRASFPTRFIRCSWMEIRTAITGSRCISRIGPATAWCCRIRTRPTFIKRTAAQVKADPENPAKDTGTGVTGPAQNRLNDVYKASAINTPLRYGHQYDFRVRLRDLSGGGAEARCDARQWKARRRSGAVNSNVTSRLTSRASRIFRPAPMRWAIPTVSRSSGRSSAIPRWFIHGKYADPVTLLKNASRDMLLRTPPEREAFGIHDPDVDRIEITVEVETLKMDNLQSVSGKENYVLLYTTERKFPAIAGGR